jgi:hypothetical protein
VADTVAAALLEVEALCETRIPVDLRDRVRLEASRRGNAITIAGRRPPWDPDFGPEWTTAHVAQLRLDPSSQLWTFALEARRRALVSVRRAASGTGGRGTAP